MPEINHVSVPLAEPLVSLAGLFQVTLLTPTLSSALPDKLTDAEFVSYVPPLVGPDMVTVGGLVSADVSGGGGLVSAGGLVV
jgi:hypothetical protein